MDYVGLAGMMVLHFWFASISRKKTEYLTGLVAATVVGGSTLFYAFPIVWAVYRASTGMILDVAE